MNRPPGRPMSRPAKVVFFDLGETLVTQNIEDNMVTRNALREISPILPKRVSPERMFELYHEGYKINETIRSRHHVEHGRDQKTGSGNIPLCTNAIQSSTRRSRHGWRLGNTRHWRRIHLRTQDSSSGQKTPHRE